MGKIPDLEHTKKIVTVALIVSLVGIGIFGSLTVYNYVQSIETADNLQEDLDVEFLRMEASDGVLLKSLLFVSKENALKTDGSVPLIVCCHGMNGDFWYFNDLYYTLAQRGYAVLSPEFRGHKSNSGASTYGNLEPYDIIGWLDYLEEYTEFINTSASGILGHSMGGLFATGAYIFESLGKGRFQALVDLSGAVNITRALEQYMNDPEILGQLSFTDNITAKNPINYVTPTFPENVLIIHGSVDTIVDVQCSIDFFEQLNPYRNRTDVEFYILEGSGHEIFYDSVYRNASAWFDKYILDLNTVPNSVEILRNPYNESYGYRFQSYLFVCCMFLILLTGCSTYLIKPIVFKPKIPPVFERDLRILDLDAIPKRKISTRIILLFSFTAINGLAFLVLYFVNLYSISGIVVTAGLSFLYVLIVYALGSREDKKNFYRWINPKVALIWILAITFWIMFYLTIPSLSLVEDRILYAGVRITWYLPFLTISIALQVISNILFIRFVYFGNNPKTKFGEWRQKYFSFTEPSLSGIFVLLSTLIVLSSYWPNYLIIPAFDTTLSFVPVFSVIYGLAFMGFTALSRYLSNFSKTIVLGAVLSGLIPTMILSQSPLTFIY